MKSAQILNVRVDDIHADRLIGQLKENEFQAIFTVNPEYILLASSNRVVRETINQASTVTADGVGIRFAAAALYEPIPSLLTGVDAMHLLLEWAYSKHKTVGLLGTNHPNIMDECVASIRKKMPELRMETCVPGVVVKTTEASLPDAAKALLQADIIFIAMPMITQIAYTNRLREAGYRGIVMGIGGAIDMYGGKFRRAPKWMRSLGLEWVWRFLEEPTRISRTFRAVIVFPLVIAHETIKKRTFFSACTRVFKTLMKL